MRMSDRQAFYNKLKSQLEDTTDFPSDYMYKFIVPTSGNQEQEVKDIFQAGGPVINTKKSKKGNYISVSIILNLRSADEVIDYYKKVENIEGIISL